MGYRTDRNYLSYESKLAAFIGICEEMPTFSRVSPVFYMYFLPTSYLLLGGFSCAYIAIY
jgi:hypothetical protein